MLNKYAPLQERGADGYCLLGNPWLLQTVAALDAHNVGFLRWFLSAGRTRQKIVKAVLATISLNDPAMFLHRLGIAAPHHPPCQLSTVARQIKEAKPHAVLAAAFGDCPPAFLPAIARCRFGKPESYSRLFAMFTEKADRPKIRALAHLPLTDAALEIADAVPSIFLRPKFLQSVGSPEAAMLVAQSLETAQQMGDGPCDPARLGQIENLEGYRTFLEGRMRTVQMAISVAPLGGRFGDRLGSSTLDQMA